MWTPEEVGNMGTLPFVSKNDIILCIVICQSIYVI